jgi:hypothetical protein
VLAAALWVTGARPGASPAPRFTRVTTGAVFTDRASTGGVTWVDYDADGDLDLFVTNGYDVSAPKPAAQPDRLYRNDGGTFTPVTDTPLTADSAFSSGSTWADYDNDGDLDAFVSTQLNRPDLLYRNEGGGRFTAVREGVVVSTPGSSFASSWADVDGDGWVDLLVSNGGLTQPEPNFLFRNNRDGTFARVTEGPIVADSARSGGGSGADYDNDGDQDLFVPRIATRGAPTGALFRNEGGWRFTRVAGDPVVSDTLMAPSAAWGDMDNDGDLDLAVGSISGYASRLYRNGGDGTFTRVAEGDFVTSPGSAYAVNWADVDNDGDLDLLQANWGATSYLFLNRGDGTLDRAPAGDLGRAIGYASSATWGDVDGDGDLDLYIGNWPNSPGAGEENQLYRNDGANGNWLLVRLAGTGASNRAALGARITVRASIGGRPRAQTREVAAHAGWRSQNPLEQHFGLGDAERAEEVVVRWPSGRVERIVGVSANQRVTITEGEGRAIPERRAVGAAH